MNGPSLIVDNMVISIPAYAGLHRAGFLTLHVRPAGLSMPSLTLGHGLDSPYALGLAVAR
jgi:hypothetical protein